VSITDFRNLTSAACKLDYPDVITQVTFPKRQLILSHRISSVCLCSFLESILLSRACRWILQFYNTFHYDMKYYTLESCWIILLTQPQISRLRSYKFQWDHKTSSVKKVNTLYLIMHCSVAYLGCCGPSAQVTTGLHDLRIAQSV